MKNCSFKIRLAIILIGTIIISIMAIGMATKYINISNNGYVILSTRSIDNILQEDIEIFRKLQSEGTYNRPISYLTSQGYRVAVLENKIFIDNIQILNLSNPGENPYIYQSLVERYLLFVILCILIISILAISISNKMTRPVHSILNGIEEIEKGNLEYTIDVTSQDEVGKIGESFNLMTLSLKSIFKEMEHQKEAMYNKNWELNNANMELEASYEQLQATIDQLTEAEDKYRSLVNNMPEIVCVIDYERNIVFINNIVKRILEYDKEELLGQKIDSFVAIPDIEYYFNALFEQFNTTSFIHEEIPLIKKNGEKIITEVKITQYISKGQRMGIQVIGRDITKKREMEEAIFHSNRDMEMLNYLSKSLNSSIELDKVLKIIGQEIVEGLNVPMCLVRLLDESGNFLIVKAFAGEYFDEDCHLDSFPVINIHDDPMGQVILEEEIIQTNKIEGTWFLHGWNDKKEHKEKIKEVVFIPLACKGKKLGLIAVGTNKAMSNTHTLLLSSIANNASVAIDNAMLHYHSKQHYVKIIDALVAVIEAKDKYTQGHSQRVASYAVEITKHLGLDNAAIEDIKIAGILHDIGKIGISDNILQKKGPLTKDEYDEIKKHPTISKKILQPVGLSKNILRAIEYHHERFDGKGYPDGLKGTELSIEAQIIAVADAFDAMTTNRSYRKALTIETAVDELIDNKGLQFNPMIVDIMVDIFKREKEVIMRIKSEQQEEIVS